MVESVERLGAQLQADAFANARTLDQRQIEIRTPQVPQVAKIQRSGAQSERRLDLESRRQVANRVDQLAGRIDQAGIEPTVRGWIVQHGIADYVHAARHGLGYADHPHTI